MTRRVIPGQVLEVRELQRPGKRKAQLELGGASFEKWLGAIAERRRAGEPLAVLVSWPSATHVVVVRTA